MRAGMLKDTVTFQKYDGAEWTDHLTCHAYINGVSGNEFFIANAGDTAALTVTVTVRYTPDIMRITPMEYRAVCGGIVYELMYSQKLLTELLILFSRITAANL